jgi:hypothetical protein
MASLLRTGDASSGSASAADLRLRQQVILQFLEEHLPHPSRIDVSVRGGVVTLAGELDNGAQRASAEEALQRVAGVREAIVNWVLWRTRQDGITPPAQPVSIGGRPEPAASSAVEVPAWWLEVRAKLLCQEIDRQACDEAARHHPNQAQPAHPDTEPFAATPSAGDPDGSGLAPIAYPHRFK